MRALITGVIFSLFVSVGAASYTATEITATYRFPEIFGSAFAIPISNHGTFPPAVRIAQTFTAEVDGWLHHAAVTAASLDTNTSGLSLAVTSLIGGQPGTILATAPLQGLHINGFFSDIHALNATADFSSSQVHLEANQKYALLFFPNRLNSHFQILGHQTITSPPGYAGGEILRSENGGAFQPLPIGEFVFEVTVTTIPEPAGVILLALASVGLLLGRFSF